MTEARMTLCAAFLLLLACGDRTDRQELTPAPQAPEASLAAHKEAPVAFAPKNIFLADSVNALPHGDPAQQDATALPGPLDETRRLDPEEIEYRFLGPAYFGASTSGVYADGGRVLWANGVNGLYKLDYETYEILAHLPTPAAEKYTQEWAEDVTASLDKSTKFSNFRTALKAVEPFKDLSGVYNVVGENGWLYIARNDGTLIAYGDAVDGDRRSAIVEKATFVFPEKAAGLSVGMNMTYDGWIVLPTEEGWLIAVSADLSEHRLVRLRHADEEDTTSEGVGYGWVRNGVAVDDDGGVYVASRNHMHKVVWRDEAFSVDEADGAWTALYRNGTGSGTGATPSLMGFGDEDRFVVITDGDERMNVTLFWRDDVPASWETLDGAPSRRIAGMAPVTMGALDLKQVQTEQTVVVAGHGALVVNNGARNVPFFFPARGRARGLFIGPLGSNPKFQPYGVQKFHWDPTARRLYSSWVNEDVSSPNGVPFVSLGSQQVYFIGARNNAWTLEALDWWTGEETFHFILGGQNFNSQFSGPFIDEKARLSYGTMWGRARIQPHTD